MTLHVLFWIQYIVPSHLGFPMNMGKKIIDDNRHKVMTIPNIDFRSRCNKNVKRSCTGTLLLGIAPGLPPFIVDGIVTGFIRGLPVTSTFKLLIIFSSWLLLPIWSLVSKNRRSMIQWNGTVFKYFVHITCHEVWFHKLEAPRRLQSLTWFSIWHLKLIENGGVTHNFENGPPKDHFNSNFWAKDFDVIFIS